MGNILETSSLDPFTAVYCGMLDMLEAHQGFVDRVRPANRIKWLGQKIDPRKEGSTTNTDKPEVRIDPGTPFARIDATSGTALMVVSWEILIATNAQPLDAMGVNGIGGGIFGVLWEIFRALNGWTQSIKALTFNRAKFVHKVKPGLPILAIDNKEANRGTCGWSAGWNYETWLNFNTLLNMPIPVTA